MAAPPRRRRTDSAGGSSTCRPPGPAAAKPGSRYGPPKRHGRYGCTSTSAAPVVTRLGERAAQPAGPAEAVQRQPGREPEAAHARHRAEQRVAVGRHRVRMADERGHTGVVEEREPSHRSCHQLLEPGVVGWKHSRAVLPRHAVVPARHRVRLVAAEENAPALGLAVDQVVGVAEARHLACELVALDRVQRDVLVVDRDRACECAGHRGDLRRPHPGRVHDRLRLDTALPGQDRPHLAAGPELDAGDARVGPDLDPELARGARHGIRRDMRVDVPVARHPHRAVQRLRRRGRKQAANLLRADELRIEADPVGAADAAAELEEALGARRDPQRADHLEDPELLVELDAVAAEPHHRRRRVELRHEPGRVMRRAARQLALLDQHHVPHARLREVVGAADAGDPAADHDGAHTGSRNCDVHATMRVRSPRKTSRATSTTRPAAS